MMMNQNIWSHHHHQCPRLVCTCQHYQLFLVTRKRRPTTALVFKSHSSLVHFFLLGMALVVNLASGQLKIHDDIDCSHPNADYAWSSVHEALPLGGEADNGLLLWCDRSGSSSRAQTGHLTGHCISQPDAGKLVVHPSEAHRGHGSSGPSDLASKCEPLKEDIARRINVSDIQKTKKLRFILGFGNRFWYGNDYGPQMTKGSDRLLKLNVHFDHPDIDAWARRYLADQAIQAVGLVETGVNEPSLPSLLLAIDDPRLVNVLKYQPVDGEKGISSAGAASDWQEPISLGHILVPINAMFLPDVHYRQTMTVFLFFNAHFALINLNLPKPGEVVDRHENLRREKTLLQTFPILPAQGIMGCPIHLCWWPVLDDLFYHQGVYYFIQGRWLWTFLEGSEYAFYSLMAKDVLDLVTALDIHHPVQGAYYDFNLGHLAVIHCTDHHRKRHLIAELPVRVDPTSGRAERNYHQNAAANRSYSEARIELENDQVVSASMMPPKAGKKAELWLVVTSSVGGQKVLRSFSLHESGKRKGFFIYIKSSQPGDRFLFPGLTGFFYHHRLGHFFFLTGYFLYAFKNSELKGMADSHCSVIEFSRFFNCTGYFEASRMDGFGPDHQEARRGGRGSGGRKARAAGEASETHIFTTQEKFTDDARRFHRGGLDGKFLPGQCNWLRKYDPGAQAGIPFTDKQAEAEDGSGSGDSKSGLLLWLGVAGVVTLIVAITTVVCMLCTGRRGKKGRNRGKIGGGRTSSGEKRRLEQELKLKAYLRRQMSSMAARGGKNSPYGKSGQVSRSASTSTGSSGSGSGGPRSPVVGSSGKQASRKAAAAGQR